MIFSIKNDSKAPEHIAPGPCCFLVWVMGGGSFFVRLLALFGL